MTFDIAECCNAFNGLSTLKSGCTQRILFQRNNSPDLRLFDGTNASLSFDSKWRIFSSLCLNRTFRHHSTFWAMLKNRMLIWEPPLPCNIFMLLQNHSGIWESFSPGFHLWRFGRNQLSPVVNSTLALPQKSSSLGLLSTLFAPCSPERPVHSRPGERCRRVQLQDRIHAQAGGRAQDQHKLWRRPRYRVTL